MRKPTIRDVAKAAKVSTGTVSRVGANSLHVNEETRRRVLDAMLEIGYVPNIAARAMRTRRTMMVGLLVPDFSNPLFSKVAKAAEKVLSQAGYSLFLHSSERTPASEKAFFRLAAEHRMDGVIVSLSDETNIETIQALNGFDGPVVILDRDTSVDRDVVFSEHAEAARRATQHLISLGHTKIGLIAAATTIRPGRERLRGYMDALQSAGLPMPPDLVRCGHQSVEYGYDQLLRMMRGTTPPTAVIAAGNDIMQGVLKAIRTLTLNIPQDLSVIGADDPELSEMMTPPITIIYRDMTAVGDAAARLLVARMQSGGLEVPTSKLYLPSVVLLRESTGAPSGAREWNDRRVTR